jgi:hypothetical protein
MKKNQPEVTVKFRSPSFRYKGVKYISAVVESKAAEGDEEAIALIANLVQMRSGVVQVIEEAQAPAPKEKKGKAEKAPKAPKETKPLTAPTAEAGTPDEPGAATEGGTTNE